MAVPPTPAQTVSWSIPITNTEYHHLQNRIIYKRSFLRVKFWNNGMRCMSCYVSVYVYFISAGYISLTSYIFMYIILDTTTVRILNLFLSYFTQAFVSRKFKPVENISGCFLCIYIIFNSRRRTQNIHYCNRKRCILHSHTICSCICNTLGLYLLSGRTSYRQKSWNVEATRFGFRLYQSPCKLADTSAVAMMICLSNISAILSL